MHVSDLPPVNASLNALSTVFILAGIAFIKNDMKLAHIISMICALVTSTVFLTCYVIYHAARHGVPTHFTYPGWPKALYFFILFTHLPLAIVTVPLVFMTIIPAFKAIYEKHRKIAKWTFPIWLYVSVTGVLVYLMLYVWFPSAEIVR